MGQFEIHRFNPKIRIARGSGIVDFFLKRTSIHLDLSKLRGLFSWRIAELPHRVSRILLQKSHR